jgi:hypothetical protein
MRRVRWSSPRSMVRMPCGAQRATRRGSSPIAGLTQSISGARRTCASGGATRGVLAGSTGAGAVGQQQVSDATGVHVCECRVQCPALRWTLVQPAAVDANVTMSITLRTCAARALMDMMPSLGAHAVPPNSGRFSGRNPEDCRASRAYFSGRLPEIPHFGVLALHEGTGYPSREPGEPRESCEPRTVACPRRFTTT